jgi:hypothetical protein
VAADNVKTNGAQIFLFLAHGRPKFVSFLTARPFCRDAAGPRRRGQGASGRTVMGRAIGLERKKLASGTKFC